MTILWFLVQLAGAVMLLLYAVRMVRTGIERAFGPSFKRVMTQRSNRLGAAGMGLVFAIVLQSSSAVALLAASFAGTGALSFPAGLSLILGGNLGSALLIQILSFPLGWLVPVLLALGGGLFLRSERRGVRQAGRILMGIAFILISLRFLRETMEPISDSDFLPLIAGYLESDYVTAALVGLALAFIMFSSVAVILLCVTLVQIGAIPLLAGVSLVLGANMGSALIPAWLARGMPPMGRRVPMASMVLACGFAVLALVGVNQLPVLPLIEGHNTGQTLVNVHVLFNVLLLLVGLPLVGLADRISRRLVPPAPTVHPEALPESHRSVLDESVRDNPRLALADLRREVLRMLQIVESQMRPVMELYQEFDKPRMQALRQVDQVVNEALDGMRRYVARINPESFGEDAYEQARNLLEYAIAIEAAGDIVVKQLLPIAQERSERRIRFSDSGLKELLSMHEQIISNLRLALSVLISDDLESARLLAEAKDEIARTERRNRLAHLRRLSEGTELSFQSSDEHLETLRALKEFNSRIASVAYPMLEHEGQLLATRLV
ncbi:Na/Pi cotransporter family protein [Pontibaca methylaminivorans]|uniref:Phosphate:Na+ symporter n=1 Tax=Pontibaca methylaminivorans TaxID=515897 RepID=A0A1R3WT60_9RHOB|nr:Na/Pi cotransporter family protein [Pontibaca methylaminivorans]SIT80755.1 phosphate:Na+ symporter [Pontibaca methylaminivorans]